MNRSTPLYRFFARFALLGAACLLWLPAAGCGEKTTGDQVDDAQESATESLSDAAEAVEDAGK